MVRLPEPWEGVDFNLDSSGVAGFFGGEEAISAMATVHLYRGRKWLGWYVNSRLPLQHLLTES
jgi:hypothetical protein